MAWLWPIWWTGDVVIRKERSAEYDRRACANLLHKCRREYAQRRALGIHDGTKGVIGDDRSAISQIRAGFR
jgi:hypothetical protein